MDTLTIPRPSQLDKIFRLHTPTWRTTPPSRITCAEPIRGLEDWLASECPGEHQVHEEAA